MQYFPQLSKSNRIRHVDQYFTHATDGTPRYKCKKKSCSTTQNTNTDRQINPRKCQCQPNASQNCTTCPKKKLIHHSKDGLEIEESVYANQEHRRNTQYTKQRTPKCTHFLWKTFDFCSIRLMNFHRIQHPYITLTPT